MCFLTEWSHGCDLEVAYGSKEGQAGWHSRDVFPCFTLHQYSSRRRRQIWRVIGGRLLGCLGQGRKMQSEDDRVNVCCLLCNLSWRSRWQRRAKSGARFKSRRTVTGHDFFSASSLTSCAVIGATTFLNSIDSKSYIGLDVASCRQRKATLEPPFRSPGFRACGHLRR